MKKISSLLFSLLVYTITVISQYPIHELEAIEDTWVKKSIPDSNLNAETGMHVMNYKGNVSEVYLMYDISGITPMDSAVLESRGGSLIEIEDFDTDNYSYVLELHGIKNNDWNENTLTWNTKPGGKRESLAKLDAKNKVGGKYYITGEKIINYVNDAIRNNKEQVSFVITGEKNAPGLGAWLSGEKWVAPKLSFYNKTGDVAAPSISPGTGYYPKAEITLKSEPGTEIYYTTNRTLPNKNSSKYENPFSISKDAVITAIAYKDDEKSRFSREFIFIGDDKPLELEVDLTRKKSSLNNIWKSTGFSPAEFLLRSDMQQTFDYQGAIPNVTVNYVRPHYLLNLVAVEGIETEFPRYNWSKLDKALDVLVRNDLKPIFEIMGTPSSSLTELSSRFDDRYQEQIGGHETYFTNFMEREKVVAWKRLVKDLAAHLIERYGQEEIRSWYFETSNEPDIGHFWKHSVEEFLNYYDACSEALLEVDPAIRFGGPGSAGGISEIFMALMAHCDTGTNYLTGEKGVRIDFISFHVKDRTDKMLEREKGIIAYVMENHPRFADLTFINDEADPIVGWSKNRWWRTGEWYAAFIVESIDMHYRQLIDSMGINYGFVSNDNAFMGDWYNRTQLARFQHPEAKERFSMIKKPVLTVTSMLGLLGRNIIESEVPGDVDDHLGIIPTVHADGKIAVLLYNKGQVVSLDKKNPVLEDKGKIASEHKTVDLSFKNLPLDNYTLVEYRIDDEISNPYAKWIEMGRPENPTKAQLDTLRAHMELETTGPPERVALTSESFSRMVNMPSSSVSLLLLVPESFSTPAKVEQLYAREYTGLNNENDIMLKWYYPGNNVLTYEVWYKQSETDDFTKINPVNFIDKAYLHSREPGTKGGYYKVRAIDYWNRKGTFSDVLKLN